MAAGTTRKISAASARAHTRKLKPKTSSSSILSGMFKKIFLVFFMGIFAWAYQATRPPPPRICGSADGPPVTASRIKLNDGRYLAYKEYGVPKENAKHKIVFIHGINSCRHDVAAITASLSPDIVESQGIYIVSFDRPGYGESDPHPSQTVKSLAFDIEELADQLGLGSKFYVIGFSIGGQIVWTCLKYIPHRLAGAVLLAPVVNYWWPGIPSNISKEAYYQQLPQDQRALRVAHYIPWLNYWWNTQKLFPFSSVIAYSTSVYSNKDMELAPKIHSLRKEFEVMANTNSSAWNLPIGRSASDDPSSPYFLHHSDNPESDINLVNAWTRNNNIVISWLLNSVSKEISASVLFADSAVDIWNDLRDRFQQSNAPRIFQLRRDLITLRQEQDPVSIYFTKLKAIWEELNQFRTGCNCGKCTCTGVKNLENHVQMEYTMTFLMGLNESFAHVRSQVLLLDPLPPINRVFALVVQEERQRSVGTPNVSTNGMSFILNGDHSSSQHNNWAPQKFQKGRPFCTACNGPGHTVDTCCKIHGYPPGYKHRNKNQNKNSTTPVNQISGSSQSNDVDVSSSSMLQNFDKNQMEQLMAMFVQHLSTSHKKNDSQEESSNSFASGSHNHEDDWQG